ncbi:MAG: hypothetical protein LUO89_03710 [Methanothrix sp.]|nr:hypothetical protein [Methanothrix sp.]
MEQGPLVYDTTGWIGGRWRQVVCHTQSDTLPAKYRLDIPGAGEFAISGDGESVSIVSLAAQPEAGLLAETLLGPVKILALALRGLFCLHASAVMAGDNAVLFLGESGDGKSTLARFLSSMETSPWPRLADDVLPVKMASGRLIASSGFPQLKLSWEEQPFQYAPEQVSVGAIYLLSNTDMDEPGIQTLSAYEATLALIHHTIASTLFDRDLLQRHLVFCAQAARSIPMRRLIYPHRYELLLQVRTMIAADIEKIVCPHATTPYS